MLRKGGMVGYTVESWRVEFGERGVCVLAVEAFLVAVDPSRASAMGPKVGLHWVLGFGVGGG